MAEDICDIVKSDVHQIIACTSVSICQHKSPSRATFWALQVLARMLVSKHAIIIYMNGSKTLIIKQHWIFSRSTHVLGANTFLVSSTNKELLLHMRNLDLCWYFGVVGRCHPRLFLGHRMSDARLFLSYDKSLWTDRFFASISVFTSIYNDINKKCEKT